jgi:ABC-type uncharacterized transport system substrate-binding protein
MGLTMTMTMKTTRLAARVALLVAGVLAAGLVQAQADAGKTRPYRILHVMSYHQGLFWSDDQYAGFRDALAGVAVEYRVLAMDVQRNRSKDWAEQRAGEARSLIGEWKPDLVYTSDDDAQEHVARHYVNKDLPFVFSGVDRDLNAYGFVGARNVAGVPEQLQIAGSARLLQAVAPGVKRILMISDRAAHWPAVVAKIKQGVAQVPGVEIVGWELVSTYEAYQRVVRDAPAKVDALWTLGLNLKDAGGRDVPLAELMKWTVENSRLPDVAVWDSRVHLGALVAVTVSGREQGVAAGRLARAILVEHKSPASLPMVAAGKGVPMINLARANKLGLKVKSSVLLSAEVISRYQWETP